MVKNPAASAGELGQIPGLGRPRMHAAAEPESTVQLLYTVRNFFVKKNIYLFECVGS